MKKLFILILSVISLQCFSQSTVPPGFTGFPSNISYNGMWALRYLNIPLGDTVTASVKGVGQLLQDVSGTVWHVVSLTGKRWEPIGGGGGTGVTSIGMTTTGALSVSPSNISSSGTFGLTWNSTAANWVHGDGSVSNFTNDVQTIGDARYSPLGHTHTFSQITDGPTAVGALFNAGPGITYNPTTRTFSASGSVTHDGLLTPGLVTWSGTGFTFDITPATYVIGGAQYNSPQSQITLDAADGTYDRLDVIAADITGSIVKITGTPAPSPSIPQVNPAEQVYLTAILVQAGSTTPVQISDEPIYDENTEWSHSTSGTLSASFTSTAQAKNGTKSIAVSSFSNAAEILFNKGSNLLTSNYTSISFWIYLPATFNRNANISLWFFNGTSNISEPIVCNFSKTTTGSWQQVAIPMSSFSFTSTTFTSIHVLFSGSVSSVFYMDLFKLQAGVTPPTTVSGLQSAYTKISDGTNTANAAGSDQIKFRTDNTLSVTVGSNDATHGDNVLFKADTTKLATKYYVDNHVGSAPTLQQVTTAGKTTIDYISAESLRSWPVYSGANYTSDWASAISNYGNGISAGGVLHLREFGDGSGHLGSIKTVDLSTDHDYYLPETGNSSDTLATLYDLRSVSGGGVTTMAAIGSSPNSNGASISGSTLTLQPANAFNGGVVTTGSQTFAGFKTFSSNTTFSGGFTANASSSIISGSGDAFSVFNGGFSSLFVVSSDYTYGVGIIQSPASGYALSVNGKVQLSDLQINNQFTPTTSTDATYSNKTLTADDTYLWYRTSTGTWKKIAWTAF